ncbi:GNAT family N-acetyltransferase [Pantoea dispersa]|uniref:GNAT family N-acetyltransferase n=1 Tax=Pantoea dispersa TaxID=59814 RepID=UPI0039B68838
MTISEVSKEEYHLLIQVWEDAVRATHHFLNEQDILRLRQLILENYFDAVVLRKVSDENHDIVGFIGVQDENIEMLFVSPAHHKKGIGARLVHYAIRHLSAKSVDVNEQNTAALGFYQHLGFQVTGRSSVDGEGKPLPLLHLKLMQ